MHEFQASATDDILRSGQTLTALVTGVLERKPVDISSAILHSQVELSRHEK